jgi:hypothetical protein
VQNVIEFVKPNLVLPAAHAAHVKDVAVAETKEYPVSHLQFPILIWPAHCVELPIGQLVQISV